MWCRPSQSARDICLRSKLEDTWAEGGLASPLTVELRGENQDGGLSKQACRSRFMSPGPSPTCRKCGQGEETAIHLLFYCDSLRTERGQLREGGRLDVQKLLTTKKGYKKIGKWMIQYAGIDQFRLSGSLLYGRPD